MLKDEERQNLDSEYRDLKFIDLKNTLGNKELNLSDFWKTISEMKRVDSSYAFPTLSKFIQKTLVLPHSSANV